MTEIIQYVYYRVVHLFRRFSKSDKSVCNSNAIVFLSTCLILNAFSIISIILYFVFDVTSIEVSNFMNKSDIGFMLSLCFILIITWFFLFLFIDDEDSFYFQLEKKYQDENHRTLKGVLIIGYTIVTVISPFLIGRLTNY